MVAMAMVMSGKRAGILLLLFALFALMPSMPGAQPTMNTHIIFIIPSVVSFRITLPGTGGFNQTGGGSFITPDIAFNSSLNLTGGRSTATGINASIRYAPELNQSDASGIFNYTNTGNTFLNLTLFLSKALPMNFSGNPGTNVNNSLRLYAMNRTPGAGAAIAPAEPCVTSGSILGANNTCIYINGTEGNAQPGTGGGSMIIANLSPGATNTTYLWADFLNVSVNPVLRNVTHNATS
jgi:hypothetical protein